MEFKPLPMPDRANLSLKTTGTTSGSFSDSEKTGTTKIPANTVTVWPDLTGFSLRQLRGLKDEAETVENLKQSISRPRTNLGGNGPPGRVD